MEKFNQWYVQQFPERPVDDLALRDANTYRFSAIDHMYRFYLAGLNRVQTLNSACFMVFGASSDDNPWPSQEVLNKFAQAWMFGISNS